MDRQDSYRNPSNDELTHYGVLGMRWGVRHDRAYKTSRGNLKRKTKANKRAIKGNLKAESRNIKKNSNLTKADRRNQTKQLKADTRQALKKNKADSKQAGKDLKVATANRLYPVNSNAVNRKVILEGKGKTFLKSALLGSYGALTYDQIRGSGNGKGKQKGRVKSALISKYLSTPTGGFSQSARSEYKQNLAKREPAERVKKERYRN